MTDSGEPSSPSPSSREMPRALRELKVGQKLGRFKVRGKLGQGAAGWVVRAEDMTLQRPVALKLLPFESQRDDSHRAAAEQFLGEARRAAQLVHPGIVQILEVGRTRDLVFIAMELLEGGTLEQKLEETGTLPWRRAVEWVIEASATLGYAHGRGVIHRDVKPSNLMLTETGHVKIMDFGLAYAELAAEADQADRQLGAPDKAVAGTPYFMAPEVIRATTSPRSDAFSMGATLWYLLTGKPPYDIRKLTDVARIGKDLRLGAFSEERPDVPAPIARVLGKALEPNPDARYADAAELAQALREALREVDAPAGAAPGPTAPEATAGSARPRSRAPWIAAAAVALVAAGVAAAVLLSRPGDQHVQPGPRTASQGPAATNPDADRQGPDNAAGDTAGDQPGPPTNGVAGATDAGDAAATGSQGAGAGGAGNAPHTGNGGDGGPSTTQGGGQNNDVDHGADADDPAAPQTPEPGPRNGEPRGNDGDDGDDGRGAPPPDEPSDRVNNPGRPGDEAGEGEGQGAGAPTVEPSGGAGEAGGATEGGEGGEAAAPGGAGPSPAEPDGPILPDPPPPHPALAFNVATDLETIADLARKGVGHRFAILGRVDGRLVNRDGEDATLWIGSEDQPRAVAVRLPGVSGGDLLKQLGLPTMDDLDGRSLLVDGTLRWSGRWSAPVARVEALGRVHRTDPIAARGDNDPLIDAFEGGALVHAALSESKVRVFGRIATAEMRNGRRFAVWSLATNPTGPGVDVRISNRFFNKASRALGDGQADLVGPDARGKPVVVSGRARYDLASSAVVVKATDIDAPGVRDLPRSNVPTVEIADRQVLRRILGRSDPNRYRFTGNVAQEPNIVPTRGMIIMLQSGPMRIVVEAPREMIAGIEARFGKGGRLLHRRAIDVVGRLVDPPARAPTIRIDSPVDIERVKRRR